MAEIGHPRPISVPEPKEVRTTSPLHHDVHTHIQTPVGDHTDGNSKPMTHIGVRKLIEPRREYAGRLWWYAFHQLPKRCDESNVAKYSESSLKHLALQTKNWTSTLNSEWTVRIYFAAKMVLGASIMAQSLDYAISKNLRSVVSYLQYYAVLHSLRAILFTNPHVPWSNGDILTTTHSKTINIAVSTLAHFDRPMSEHVKASVLHLKAFRELISYRAPSSGDHFQKPNLDIHEFCRLFLEIAQLQSELLEASVEKNVTGSFSLDEDVTWHAFQVEIDGFHFPDDEDWYRMGYLARKHPSPTNILHMMSEGHVEDFFGSWCAADGDSRPDLFDPDNDWRILFDVP